MTTPEDRVPVDEFRKRAFDCLYKVAEVHKGRMTWHLALGVAIVTLTGYGFQTNNFALFLLASGVPVFQFVSDLMFKRFVVCPLVYKALVYDLQSGEKEPLSLLFLDFDRADHSSYAELRSQTDDDARRAAFKQLYLKRAIWVKAIIFGALAIMELALAFHYYHLPA